MIVRIFSILFAALLAVYLVLAAFFFRDRKQVEPCRDLVVVVTDSLDKHFVSKKELVLMLKNAGLNPVGIPLHKINTDKIERTLLENGMIARAEAYKTPSGRIKLEVKQKMPILRVISPHGDYYVDRSGGIMPVSRHYAVYVIVVSGHVEKKQATTELYEFALFLQNDNFWNDQIEQIDIHPDKEVELIPRIGNHRIVLGSFENYRKKLDDLYSFYEKVIPKVGWEKYSIINLKYKGQIVCTKR